MTTVMKRSFADAFGIKWPRTLAYIVNGKPVTWSDVHHARAERDRRNLYSKLRVDTARRAAFLWSFYQPGLFGFAYMGWHLYIRTLGRDYGIGSHDSFRLTLMQQFPCGLLPLPENFERWKEAFAHQHWRPGRFPKQGLLTGWVDLQYDRPVRFSPK